MADPLWRWDELVAAAHGAPDRAADGPVTGFSIDTRTLEPGEVFVALTDQRDGHDFVPAAFARGAAAALVRTDYARQPGDKALIRVDDPLRALERIGVAARARLAPDARVIAVTGSAGKTGTKEMLRAGLTACATAPDRVHAPEKSFNNHWGVPLTLARMPAATQFAVFEIGMNHAGEIRPLTRMVRPHVAIVTNVLPVHVGNFPDGMEGVARAKAEIFEGLEPDGTAIVPSDGVQAAGLQLAARQSGATVLTFGETPGSIGLHHVETAGGADAASQRLVAVFDARNGGDRVQFTLGMAGRHLAINALAVLLALRALRLDVDAAARALVAVAAAAGRGARQMLAADGGDLLLLDESYNANPASMAAALANLDATDTSRFGRRIAIMGDMLELGAEAVHYHVGLLPEATRADLVFCCGPNMRHLFAALPPGRQGAWTPTSAELIEPVLAALRPGDAVMVKGSLGSRMAPIVTAIKKRFAPAKG